MSRRQPRYRCPTCADEHALEDREAGGGQRRCPECGDPTAYIMDEGIDPP